MKRDYVISALDGTSFISTTSTTYTSMAGTQLFPPHSTMKDVAIKFKAEVIGLSAATKAFILDIRVNAMQTASRHNPGSFPPAHLFSLDSNSTKIEFEDYINEVADMKSFWLQWRVSQGTVMLGRRSFEIYYNLPDNLCKCPMQTILARGCQCGGA